MFQDPVGSRQDDHTMRTTKFLSPSLSVVLVALLLSIGVLAQRRQGNTVSQTTKISLHEVNPVARPDANHVVAIVGATLIDGRGGAPELDALVVIRGERIVVVGKRAS